MVDFFNPVAIGSDHAGFVIKEQISEYLKSSGFIFKDFGTYSGASMDYPDAAHPLAKAIEAREYNSGILLCGSGNGVAMVANKYRHIRAAICWNEEITKLARLHNDANVLVLPARFISTEDALKFVDIFFSTSFEGGRHAARIEKISKLL